jgi:TolB-like protein/DNA-binding winged helix-turn-helix (wHTH) protein/Tfp pilus assembly protein PilF
VSIAVEPKALRVLLYLIQNRDRLVRKQEILDGVWQEASVTEAALTRSIGLLRKALEDDSRQPRFIETVPTAGYRFIAVVRVLDQVPNEAPPTTSPAAKPSPELDQSTVESPSIIRATLVIGCIVIIIAAIGWLLQKRLQAARGVRSLAVLPLENLSGDPSQEYFADGMTDELTTLLAKDSTLRIVSRTSSMQFKDAHRSLPEIARALNVDAILEGSISRSSKKVHMTLQLVSGDTDSHLWAESYDRDTNDIAMLPDDAARAIAVRLNSSTPPHANARNINPEAHDAYLRGHYSFVVGRNEDAGRYYQKAVQIQPDYALGWSGLADYYANKALRGEVEPLQALPQAEAAARKAIELDDSLPRAHTILGGMIFFNHGDGAQALNELTRATELDSQDGEGFHLHAKILCALGRYDEAVAVQKQSTAINPFEHPGAMAEIYACTRQFDAAISDGEMRLKDFPAAPDILKFLAASYHWKGRDKEAVEMLARQISAEGDLPLSAAIRRAFETGGYAAVVSCQLAALEKRARTRRVSTFALADLHGRLSEHDETLALLEQGVNEHDPLLLLLAQSDPAFDFLHGEPRYRSLIQKMGLPPMY